MVRIDARVRAAGVAVVSLAMTLAGCAARNPPLARAFAPTPVAEASGGPRHEGIKVHGHWTIEVRNPDGGLVTHREFENALVQQNGSANLTLVLGRSATVGSWAVIVPGPCPGGCFISEVPLPGLIPLATVFPTLTVSSAVSPSALTLSGTFNAQNAAQISEVRTDLLLCPPTVAPVSFPSVSTLSGYPQFFTDATIAPISVTAGQFVQVTVVFSFS